jgi:hypothetical protein
MLTRALHLFLLILTTACVTDSDRTPGSSEELPNVVIVSPEFEGIEPRLFSRRSGNTTINSWLWLVVGHRAELGYQSADYGIVLLSHTPRSDEDVIRGWNYFKKSGYSNLRSREKIRTRIGSIKYLTLNARGNACFAFEQFFGIAQDDLGRNNKLLRGYYCRSGTADIAYETVKRIITEIHMGFSGKERSLVTNAVIGPTAAPSSKISETVSVGRPAAIPFKIHWPATGDALQGDMQVSGSQGSGSIRFDERNAEFNCSGSWKYAEGSYSSANKPKGVWAISCTNGRAVTGTYRSEKPGRGTGRGLDDQGREVKIQYGPRVD